jgi:signal transduction histidine kinase
MRHSTPRVATPSAALASALGDASISSSQAFQIPLVFRGIAYGALVASDECAGGSHLGADDRRLLEAFAAAGASAIHTNLTVAADRLRHSIAASERERRRWARELHDETLQGLGGLRVLLSSALRSSRGDTRLADAVSKAIDQLTAEIAALRALITELRPAALDQLGLVPAIETLAQRTASEHDLTVETNIELALETRHLLDPDTESSLYRLVQEALTNVTKHAAASRVEIALEQRDDTVRLRISDDGRGFEQESANGGFGLIGMRERVLLAGGRLDITSNPGEGTTLEARLPAPPAGPAAAA